MNIFKPVEIHHHHVIEVPQGHKLPELNGDLKESLKALYNHPGFQYLLQRLRFQKAAMESTLREGINLTEIQLRYLQAGIFWASQLEKDISSLTQSRPTQREAFPDEATEFAKIRQGIELVGA